MRIQVNTGHGIEGGDDLTRAVEGQVTAALERFGDRITRVEVHLSDVNADKGGRDTRCLMEARAAGIDPVAVDDLAHDVNQAVRNAAGKLERALDTRLANLRRR